MSWLMVSISCALLLAAMAGLPRIFIRRRRDRLAATVAAADDAKSLRLLTPADWRISRFRRIPGVLGLTPAELIFESIFGDRRTIPLDAVTKIVTGRVLLGGRRLWRAEVVRIDADGITSEYQMTHASAVQWRRHLGIWAARQRPHGPISGG
jgi:hypothetical protein